MFVVKITFLLSESVKAEQTTWVHERLTETAILQSRRRSLRHQDRHHNRFRRFHRHRLRAGELSGYRESVEELAGASRVCLQNCPSVGRTK
jgi:hypothetical protein